MLTAADMVVRCVCRLYQWRIQRETEGAPPHIDWRHSSSSSMDIRKQAEGLYFTEFTEATRITGGLNKHRQKPYNAYYPNN